MSGKKGLKRKMSGGGDRNPWKDKTFSEVLELCRLEDKEEREARPEKRLKSGARARRLQFIKQRQPKTTGLGPTEDRNGNDLTEHSNFIKVPENLDALKLVEARSSEIEMAEKAICAPPDKVSASQRIPLWMRRRASSHNPRRVPRFALARPRPPQQGESAVAKAAKKTRFKYKKHRASKLPKGLEFLSRQRKFRWLESHIWHAKRFKMVEKWGYKLAYHCNDKVLRALHRDVKNGSTMCDLSYFCWIELSGKQGELLECLKKLTSSECGLGFGANDFLRGAKEGHVILYEPGQYPFGCIGPVNFMWKPVKGTIGQTKDEKENCALFRFLWIYYHPSLKYPLFSNLHKILNDSQIIFKSLDNSLNIIEFTGLETFDKLKNCLHLSDVQLRHTEKIVLNKTGSAVVRKKSFWWNKMYDNPESNQDVQKMRIFYKLHTDTVQSGQVISIICRDPRFCLTDVPSESNKQMQNFSEQTLESFLWDSDVRDYVKTRKMSDKQVNSILSGKIHPGSMNILDEEARIPVMLIKSSRPNRSCEQSFRTQSQSSYNETWKLILPKNWFMPFWSFLLRRRFRPYGLRERETFLQRAGAVVFPEQCIDSKVGNLCLSLKSRSLCKELYKKPTSKRFNFERFGIDNPFSCDLALLFNETKTGIFTEGDPAASEDDLNPTFISSGLSDSVNEMRQSLVRSQSYPLKPKLTVPQILSDENELVSVQLGEKCLQLSRSSFPLNADDLSPCVNLPALVTRDSPECSKSLEELVGLAPASVTGHHSLPFFVLRDIRKLISLHELVSQMFSNKKDVSKKANIALQKKLQIFQKFSNENSSCLIMVRLSPKYGGTFNMGTKVLLPSSEDFKSKAGVNFDGEPLEAAHRRMSKKAKKGLKKEEAKGKNEASDSNEEKNKFTNEKAKGDEVRKLIGFVTHCDYNPTHGKVFAVAFCTLKGLMSLFEVRGANFSVLLCNNGNPLLHWASVELMLG